MFWNCISLKDINVSNFNTQNVWDMSFMFYRCQSVERLDLSNFNTSNVINMSMMFEGTLSLNNIIYGDNFIHDQDADINLMFEGSPALKPTHESWNGVF